MKMATSIAVISKSKSKMPSNLVSRSIYLLQYRNFIKNLNSRLYCSSVQGDKTDFFGIPEDFELQHHRHPASSKLSVTKKAKESTVNENDSAGDASETISVTKLSGRSNEIKTRLRSNNAEDNTNLIEEYHSKSTRSRRERRNNRVSVTVQHMKSYKTNFGAISVNHNTGNKNLMQSHSLPGELEDGSNTNRYQSLESGKFFQVVSNPHVNSSSSTAVPVSSSTLSGRNIDKRFRRSKTYSGTGVGVDVIDQSLTSSMVKMDIDHGNEEETSQGRQKSNALFNFNGKTFSPTTEDFHFNDIDSQYFQTNSSALSNPEHVSPIKDTISCRQEANQTPFTKISPKKSSVEKSALQLKNESNIFDEYYFPELSADSSSSNSRSVSAKDQSPPVHDKGSEFNVIDDQYFGKTDASSQDSAVFSDLVSAYNLNNDVSQHDIQNNLAEFETKPLFSKEMEPESHETHHTNLVTNKNVLFKKKKMAEQNQNEDSTSAFDLAMKIRADMNKNQNLHIHENLTSSHSNDKSQPLSNEGMELINKGHVDSKGFRILSDQVLDFDKMPSMDILETLKKSIVFDHEDFIVIDKPYGLPSIGQVNDTFSLSSLLPAFGRSLPRKYKASDLHIVQGLDRDITGNVILAKNPEAAYMLKGKFQANEVIQRYWAITKGVPSPRNGVIDIPIGVGKVGHVYKSCKDFGEDFEIHRMLLREEYIKMVLRPQYQLHKKPVGKKTSRAPCDKAVTEFSVLASHLESALVECRLLTNGVKHQMRVHLSSGLNTPILGDHKYSHFSKLAPQKLDRSTLELLRVRQAKVRHLCLHLHCRSLVLPDYKSRTYVITSHLPSFFAQNMKSLKLYLPKK